MLTKNLWFNIANRFLSFKMESTDLFAMMLFINIWYTWLLTFLWGHRFYWLANAWLSRPCRILPYQSLPNIGSISYQWSSPLARNDLARSKILSNYFSLLFQSLLLFCFPSLPQIIFLLHHFNLQSEYYQLGSHDGYSPFCWYFHGYVCFGERKSLAWAISLSWCCCLLVNL